MLIFFIYLYYNKRNFHTNHIKKIYFYQKKKDNNN